MIKIEQREVDGFMETTYSDGDDFITVKIRRGAGSCTSNFNGTCGTEEDKESHWTGVVDGLESFVLALACSGFDMRTTNVAESVFAAIESAANHE